MWPFKKISNAKATVEFNSIICIPGNWQNDDEVRHALIDATKGEYIAAGPAMINAKKDHHFTFEFCTRDERMKMSFATAGRITGISQEFLDEIDKHSSVVYITGLTGSLEKASHIAFAANAILQAGGLGVKIETAGKAFEKKLWNDLVNNFQESNLYEMFVMDALVMKDNSVFSCGMQNIGLKDTIVSGIPLEEAIELIQIFGYYQVIDKPIIHSNQTFTPRLNSRLYRITDELNPPYKDEDLFDNPFGMWRLTAE